MDDDDRARIASYDPRWKTSTENQRKELIENAKYPTFTSFCSTRFRTKSENYRTMTMLFPTLRKIQRENPDWPLFDDVDFRVGTSAYHVFKILLQLTKHFDNSTAPRPGEYYQALTFILNYASREVDQARI